MTRHFSETERQAESDKSKRVYLIFLCFALTQNLTLGDPFNMKVCALFVFMATISVLLIQDLYQLTTFVGQSYE